MSAAGAAVIWAAALGLASAVSTQPAERSRRERLPGERPPPAFAPQWDAFVGRWRGEGDGLPWHGVGGAAIFAYELDGRVLTRRSVVDYPGEAGREGVHHEDLIQVYPAPGGIDAEAMYYDNEGHVIHYAATWTSDARTLVLQSLSEEDAPRYRQTWRFEDDDTLRLDFDVAGPGSAEFTHCASGTLRRIGH